MTYTQLHCSAPSLDRHIEKENHSLYGSHKAHEKSLCSCVIVVIFFIVLYILVNIFSVMLRHLCCTGR